MHGKGVKKRKNGTLLYDGEFKNDKMHGQGTYYWSDGRITTGTLKNGFFNGKGTLTWPDGRKYVGDFKDDKIDGKGILTSSDGRIIHEGECREYQPIEKRDLSNE